MKIGIIDADLLDRGTRHPNLALMKISGFYKEQGHQVELIESYDLFYELEFFTKIYEYEKIFLSKVFTKTVVPNFILSLKNIVVGGSGIYWDDPTKYLSEEIEHHMPDYELYTNYVDKKIAEGVSENVFSDYKDKSIGFLTKGCVRQCPFCINANLKKVNAHSPLAEFFDKTKKQIYLWDDNFLAFKDWESLLDDLDKTKKPFQFRQGLDIRFLTAKKAERLSKSKYYGDYIFAFDNIADKDLIIEKLKLWKPYISKTTKLYVFCGFDRKDIYDEEFWKDDITDIFERIKILMEYGCLPYITRFEKYEESPYRGMYVNLARWCNQPNFFKKTSIRQFCEKNDELTDSGESSSMRYLEEFENKYPEIARQYFDLRYDDLNKY